MFESFSYLIFHTLYNNSEIGQECKLSFFTVITLMPNSLDLQGLSYTFLIYISFLPNIPKKPNFLPKKYITIFIFDYIQNLNTYSIF